MILSFSRGWCISRHFFVWIQNIVFEECLSTVYHAPSSSPLTVVGGPPAVTTLMSVHTGYINVGCGGKSGYYFSSTCVLVGSLSLFFIDLHRRNLARHKHGDGARQLCVSETCPQRRRLSFAPEPEELVVVSGNKASFLFLRFSLIMRPQSHYPCTQTSISNINKLQN